MTSVIHSSARGLSKQRKYHVVDCAIDSLISIRMIKVKSLNYRASRKVSSYQLWVTLINVTIKLDKWRFNFLEKEEKKITDEKNVLCEINYKLRVPIICFTTSHKFFSPRKIRRIATISKSRFTFPSHLTLIIIQSSSWVQS